MNIKVPLETVQQAIEALKLALRQECSHEERHRGGMIWEICDMCGAKWADDRGGFKPNERIGQLEAALTSLQETLK